MANNFWGILLDIYFYGVLSVDPIFKERLFSNHRRFSMWRASNHVQISAVLLGSGAAEPHKGLQTKRFG